MMTRVRVVVFAFAASMLLPATAMGKGLAPGPKSALIEGNRDLAKVSGVLLQVRSLARRSATAHLQQAFPSLPIQNGVPDIEVRLRVLTPEIVDRVRAIGMQVRGTYYNYARIVGFCDPELLDDIAAIPEVTTVYPNFRPFLQAGSVTSQADTSIHASTARSQFGVDGSGINVGVLSDSFNDTRAGVVSGAGCSRSLAGSISQASGDLPSTITLLDNGDGGGSDEGAAMAELIHDLAPGAAILFRTAFRGEADFAQGITELRDCGADVIVDDVIYFTEPMFQDGIIAQAAQESVNLGVTYFSSAGNYGPFGIDRVYVDANPASDNTVFPPNGNDFHQFGTDLGIDDRYASFAVPAGCGINLVLQWNEPFSGTLGPGASSDLDLYLCTAQNPASCVPFGATPQGCGIGAGLQQGDPLEIASYYNNTTSLVTLYAAVEHFCGNENVRFRVAALQGCGASFETRAFNKPQIFGHAAAAGVGAVAAVFYGEIDANGAAQAPPGQIDVESFSSLGGSLPFYFDASGNLLAGAPVLRFKPEIAAPDGTNTSFFGADVLGDTDAFPNFHGTSAAAPHAAAVAALMLQANPFLTPAQIMDAMRSTATDIESLGRDALSGDGLIDAAGAVANVRLPTPTPTGPTPTPTLSATGTPTATAIATETGTPLSPPTATPGCGLAPESGCRAPAVSGKATIALRDKLDDAKDTVAWVWAKGSVTPKEDFGDPISTTHYDLCLYDEASTLVMTASVPPGGLCGKKACWKATKHGFTYVNKALAPDGVQQLVLVQGLLPGKAKITAKGKGVNLDMPPLPLAGPVRVQLKNTGGACWEATYSAPLKNDAAQFKAKADVATVAAASPTPLPVTPSPTSTPIPTVTVTRTPTPTPTSTPESCDPLAQTCGPGEGCYRYAAGNFCAPVGNLIEGMACTLPNDCAKGRTCSNYAGGPRCMKFCSTTAQCCPGNPACGQLTTCSAGLCG